MKLKTHLFIVFLAIVLIPTVMTGLFLTGLLFAESGIIRRRYGISIAHLQPFDKLLIGSMLVIMFLVLILTAFLLSVWLIREFADPVSKLKDAARNIREGNLDFELPTEGNVTEIRELNEEFGLMLKNLKEANEEKVEFDRQNRELISNITHDLKTPLTAVKGYVEGIMDGVADTPEKIDRYVRTIYNKTLEMDHLINELSFYSRITTNRIPYFFERVGVRPFFDDAAEEIRNDVHAKGFAFSYINNAPEDAVVIADAEQITRVLGNLVSNAVKYNDKQERRIGLRVTQSGDEIQVGVSDNGRGIAQKDLASIFDRFYRTDASRNSSAGGSGIGLSIVKKIVEDHGGRVWATSREGEGTTMYFALRRYEEKKA